MDNYSIADQFTLLSKVLDIHGENSFKSKSYSIAAFNIEKLPVQLSSIDREQIYSYKGIGDTIGNKIIEILDTGEMTQLKDLIFKTPPGVMEMLVIKGIGPKKIYTIWKEMEIESLGELLYACNENRLLIYKGFGEKTQKNVQEAIEFYMKSRGSYLYAQAEKYALDIGRKLQEAFPQYQCELTGEFKRQLEIITMLEWVTAIPKEALKVFFEQLAYSTEIEEQSAIIVKGIEGIKLRFCLSDVSSFYTTLVETSSSKDFLDFIRENKVSVEHGAINSEEDVFQAWHQPYVPAPLRENPSIIQRIPRSALIQPANIKGIIHCHSNWSDGNSSLEDLAKACIASNMEYMVITDHSKSAVYANGLQEDRIREQHRYIDDLNASLAPFKIFKSIECDILSDGSLDYADNILATFDLVIASVHSAIKMTEEKATARLVRAIENRYTTILGHMTGRLLLSRNGYPVDHKTIIEACVANKVVIELNAHPRRLDIDWRWIDYALEKGVLISIDPDAHYIHGFDHTRYGVLAAQKAGLSKEQNLSSFNLNDFEDYLSHTRAAKGI